MATRIDGKHVYAGEEHGVLLVGFADHPEKPSQYLLLQRALAPGEQDKRLGHDRVYVELNDQANSAYGGVMHAHLDERRLVLSLDSRTAKAIGSEETLAVTLQLDTSAVQDLSRQLRKLFAGQNGALT